MTEPIEDFVFASPEVLGLSEMMSDEDRSVALNAIHRQRGDWVINAARSELASRSIALEEESQRLTAKLQDVTTKLFVIRETLGGNYHTLRHLVSGEEFYSSDEIERVLAENKSLQKLSRGEILESTRDEKPFRLRILEDSKSPTSDPYPLWSTFHKPELKKIFDDPIQIARANALIHRDYWPRSFDVQRSQDAGIISSIEHCELRHRSGIMSFKVEKPYEFFEEVSRIKMCGSATLAGTIAMVKLQQIALHDPTALANY